MSQCMELPVANLRSKPAWTYQQLQLAWKNVKVHKLSLHVNKWGNNQHSNCPMQNCGFSTGVNVLA